MGRESRKNNKKKERMIVWEKGVCVSDTLSCACDKSLHPTSQDRRTGPDLAGDVMESIGRRAASQVRAVVRRRPRPCVLGGLLAGSAERAVVAPWRRGSGRSDVGDACRMRFVYR